MAPVLESIIQYFDLNEREARGEQRRLGKTLRSPIDEYLSAFEDSVVESEVDLNKRTKACEQLRTQKTYADRERELMEREREFLLRETELQKDMVEKERRLMEIETHRIRILEAKLELDHARLMAKQEEFARGHDAEIT